MENEPSQFESALDSEIRHILVEEGYLLPFTDAEYESAMREMAEQEIVIPPHLDNPLIYLYPPEQKSAVKIIPLPKRERDEYADNFMALAAREGAGEIPADILEQMKKDRENQSDD